MEISEKNKQDKKSLYISLSILIAGLIIGGAILLANRPASPQADINSANGTENNSGNTQQNQIQITQKDHSLGNPQAPITIVEFSDFQCPYCKSFHPTMEKLVKNYPDKVRWVFKEFPLTSIHENALSAALAAECAGEQGKFWEFADKLFENNSQLGEKLYSKLASEFNLDAKQFSQCLASQKYLEKIKADYQAGIKAGVRGTPTSFINGKMISGVVPYESLEGLVKQMISQKGK
jgi:protein-disulfide isomerase